MNCPKCYYQVSEIDNICKHCGEILKTPAWMKQNLEKDVSDIPQRKFIGNKHNSLWKRLFFKKKAKRIDFKKIGKEDRLRAIKCSKCGRNLRYIGSVQKDIKKAAGGRFISFSISERGAGLVPFGILEREWEQWLGTVCTNCRLIFCDSCRDVGPGLCPNCGQKVMPAIAKYLW